jgi:hypothetical protein
MSNYTDDPRSVRVVEEIIRLDEVNPDWKPDSSWRWW